MCLSAFRINKITFIDFKISKIQLPDTKPERNTLIVTITTEKLKITKKYYF